MKRTKMMTERSAFIFLTALCSLMYFTSYFSRYILSVCIAEIDRLDLLTKENLGVATMLLFICYGTGQILSGILGDKFKPQHIVLIGLSGAAIANILLPLIVTHPVAVAILWGFHGICQAMFWPPIVKIIASNLPSARYGVSTLWVSIAAHVANISLYLLASLCIGTFEDWRILFHIGVCVCLVAILLWIFGFAYITRHYEKTPEEAKPVSKGSDTAFDKKGLIAAVVSSGAFVLLIGIILQGAIKEGVTAWLPSYITEVYNSSTSDSILKSVAIPIASIICLYAVGLLYRKLIKNEALGGALMFGVGTLMAAVIVLVPSMPPMLMIICAAILTASMHGVNLFLIAYLPARFSRFGKTSTVSGVTNACAYAGCAIYTYGIALIAENLGWNATAISWLIISGLGFVACLIAIPFWKKFISEK